MASHPPRLKDFDYIGKHRYFLTFCTRARTRVFIDRENVAPIHAQLLQSCRDHDVAVDAYCAMPDHVHLLAKGLTDASDSGRAVTTTMCFATKKGLPG